MGSKVIYFLLFFLISFFPRFVLGETDLFSILYYRPATGLEDYQVTLGSATLPSKSVLFATIFEYDYHPLEFTLNGNRTQGLVDHLFIEHLTASYAPAEKIQFDLNLPVVILSRGADDVTSVGEILIRMRLNILDAEKYPFGLTFIPFGTIPTGEDDNFLSDSKATLGILAALDKTFGPVSIGLNIGADGREHVTFRDLRSGSRFWLSGGIKAKVGKQFVVKGDLTTHTPFRDFFGNKVGSPTELLVAGDYHFGETGWKINMGGGLSVVRGAGEPLFRTLFGVNYHLK